jgi:glycosyltransferase involved in cell wall biosynthesis
VVDDGSTDGCLETISGIGDSRVHVEAHEHGGKAALLNRVISRLEGKYFLIHDADDTSYPGRVERLVYELEKKPDVAIVMSVYDLIVRGRKTAPIAWTRDSAECRECIRRFEMPSHDTTAMYRTSIASQFRFNSKLLLCETVDYLWQIGERYPIEVIPDCLYSYRVHEASLTQRLQSDRTKFEVAAVELAMRRRGLAVNCNLRPWVVKHQRWPRLVSFFLESVKTQKLRHAYSMAIKSAFDCISLAPYRVSHYVPLFRCMVPESVARILRRVRL